MTPFEALTQEEQEKITDYIAEYGDKYRSPKNSVPLSHILHFWDSAKSDLFSLFGDQLILKYPITYAQPVEDIVQECVDDPELNTLISELKKAFRSFDPTADYYEYSSLFFLDKLLSWKTTPIGSPYPYYVNYNHKEYKISSNTKTIRILGKMARDTKDANILDLYEKLRIILSQYTNQKELHGNLCLSIHPLDYMTMSDNDSGWDSCMSWMEQGDYRAGTVEMMNSPYVVVAYVESEHKQATFAGSITWNNKKWRELFLVTPNLTTEIKPYPYINEFFTKETLRRLGALQPEANFSDAFEMPVRKTFTYKDKELVFRPQATYMYNDFGLTASNKHWTIINESNLDSWQTHINYSGAMNCMSCGEEIEYNTDYSNEVFCAPCLGETTFTCDWCGRTVRNGNESSYWVENHLLCEDCWENEVMYDPIKGEDVFIDDTYRLHLVSKDNEDLGYILTTVGYFQSDDRFNIDEPRCELLSGVNIYYVYPEDIADKRFGEDLFFRFPN